jgi:hypothetical protein
VKPSGPGVFSVGSYVTVEPISLMDARLFIYLFSGIGV